MGYFKRLFGHLGTLITHKWLVLKYANLLGIPWRGLVHDLSKFSPVEFNESVKYWSGKKSPILAAKDDVGVSYAWLHHKGRNKHHYEYWLDSVHDEEVAHKIPFNYVLEMICDWLSACRTYTGAVGQELYEKEWDWWMKRGPKIKIHFETKILINRILWNLRENHSYYKNEDRTFEIIRKNLKYWKEKYEEKLLELYE